MPDPLPEPSRDPAPQPVPEDVAVSRALPGHGPRLVLATHNQGKLRELREMLQQALPELDAQTAVVDAGTLGLPEPVEDGTSFAANALIKARAAAAASGLPSVADDSGLAVEILGGAPGLFSARWSGTHGDDRANLDLLLAQLDEVPQQHRGAGFVCAAALVTAQGHERVEHGALQGTLLREPAGEHGFGYDPILQPDGFQVSCAQLTPEQKNAISHRGQAIRALIPHIVEVIQGAADSEAAGEQHPTGIRPRRGEEI